MTRRSSRRRSRKVLMTRAPRKGTLIVASILYIVGLFGVLGFFNIPETYAIVALAIAGGLLILGALLRGV
ncbi:MAG: hypothetical protein SWK90_03055 [Chloroflexota bacterium]|nr:hypothetical protein [Chloroflexota bacterium]